jgi:hypothetical protein
MNEVFVREARNGRSWVRRFPTKNLALLCMWRCRLRGLQAELIRRGPTSPKDGPAVPAAGPQVTDTGCLRP